MQHDRYQRKLALLALALGTLFALGTALAQDTGGDYRVYVSNEYGANVTVIDGKTAEVIDTISISGRPGEVRPRGMAVSPDGKIIYVSISDFQPERETPEDEISAIDVATDTVTRTFRAGGNPERLAINPDGTRLWASLEAIAQGAVFDTASGERLAVFTVGIEPEGVAVSPDGKWAYITAESTHTVAIIDTQALKVAKFVLVGNRPRFAIFSRDGSKAYVSAEIGGTISVIDTASQAVTSTISLGLDSRPVGMDLSPDGSRLYVAGGGTNAVYVIDTASQEVEKVITEKMGRRPWGIAVSPDGSTIYTANGLSDSVSILDADCLCVVDNVSAGRGAHSVKIGRIPDDQ